MESRVTNERVENALQHPSHTPLSHIISPPPYASLTHSLTHPLITPLSLTELLGAEPDHHTYPLPSLSQIPRLSHTPSHMLSPSPTHPTLITPLSLTELQGPGPDHQQHRGGQRRFLAVRHHLL